SPPSVKATIDGVVRLPSEFGMTTGSPPSITATHELVVPRSMPMTLPISAHPRKSSLRFGVRARAGVPIAGASLGTGPRRDDHHRRPHQPIVERVAPDDLLHHHVGGVLRALHLLE